MGIDNNFKYSDKTEKIIKCAYNVHNYLGNGFPEVIYQRCMEIEFDKQSLTFKREIEKPIYYCDTLVGSRRVDFIVEDVILLELKAIKELSENYYSQILNYLKAYKLEIGLLINFGEKELKIKRFIQTNY